MPRSSSSRRSRTGAAIALALLMVLAVGLLVDPHAGALPPRDATDGQQRLAVRRDGVGYVVEPGRPVTIGRAPENRIRLGLKFVSKTHAEVILQDGLFVTDLGSTHGTIVWRDGKSKPPGTMTARDTLKLQGASVSLATSDLVLIDGLPISVEPVDPQAIILRDQQGNAVVGDATITAGRSPSNIIATPNPQVSRQHARFVPESDGGVMVEDLQTLNGTTVNGTLVTPGTSVEVLPGDTVGLGPNQQLAVERAGGPGTPPPAGGQQANTGIPDPGPGRPDQCQTRQPAAASRAVTCGQPSQRPTPECEPAAAAQLGAFCAPPRDPSPGEQCQTAPDQTTPSCAPPATDPTSTGDPCGQGTTSAGSASCLPPEPAVPTPGPGSCGPVTPGQRTASIQCPNPIGPVRLAPSAQ